MREFMRKKSSKIIAAILAVVIALGGCSGTPQTSNNSGGNTSQSSGSTKQEGNSAGGDEVITLTFFDKNTGDTFTNAVAEEITRRTGIMIEIQQPTGDPEEKLNLMLASGDLPDIVLMDRRSTIVSRYISGGALVPLNDLIDQYGPDIEEMYGDILAKSRFTDGQNYYLNNWYGLDTDPDRGVSMRMDILEEFGYGEKAKNGEYFTQTEFIDLLTQFKSTYPTIDGQTSIPFTVNGDGMSASNAGSLSIFKGMYGIKNYYETEDHQIMFDVKDPRYLDMIKFINRLYRDGLLDKEWIVNKEQSYKQKVSSGAVFAAGNFPSDENRLFREKYGEDTNTQFYMFRVVADGADPDNTTFSPRSTLGWDAIGITVTNKYPVETMKLINFLVSEEGQYLLMWGIEGEHWDMVDGQRIPRPETLQGFQDDWSEYAKETGIRKWTWFIKNGYGSDGSPYDMAVKYERDDITLHNIESMEGSVWDVSPYDNLGPEGGTAEALMEQKLFDIMDKAFADMTYADSEAEVEQLYQALLKEMEVNQAETIEAIYTKTYNERLSLWE